jgi:hypothetical protein
MALTLSAAEETTQSRLAHYGTDLAEAWTTYPKDKDETARRQKINDLTAAFTSGLNKLNPPENFTIDRMINSYLDNLNKAKTLFRLEKTFQDRAQYLAACGQVFRREIPTATDLKTERTVNKCFEMLVEWCVDAKPRLRLVPEDVHSNVYAGFGEVFNAMIKFAKKDEGDPTAIYDRQLKDIRRKFPTTSPDFARVNQPILSMLEGAAKTANTFNKK